MASNARAQNEKIIPIENKTKQNERNHSVIKKIHPRKFIEKNFEMQTNGLYAVGKA